MNFDSTFGNILIDTLRVIGLPAIVSSICVIAKLWHKLQVADLSIERVEKTLKEIEEKESAYSSLSKDVDALFEGHRTNVRTLEGLQRDVMELSSSVLTKLTEELKPLTTSIQLLTERSISNESAVNYLKESFEDIKETMREIKDDVKHRPCIAHNY